MQKPTQIDAFMGDTINIRIAVYGDNGQPFDLATNGLTNAQLHVQGMGQPLGGTIEGNLVAFRITPNQGLGKDQHNFYAQVTGKTWPSDRYTIAYGVITIHALPEL